MELLFHVLVLKVIDSLQKKEYRLYIAGELLHFALILMTELKTNESAVFTFEGSLSI